MADRQDSNGNTPISTGAATSDGRGGASAGDSSTERMASPLAGQSPDMVPRSQLDEERKRRAGQERAHQRDMKKVQDELAELKAAITTNLQNRQPGDARVAVSQEILSSLDLSDPKDKLLHDLYVNQSQWSQEMRRNAEESQNRQRNQRAVEEAIDDVVEEFSVPRDALDTSSPEAVRRSAEQWVKDEEIRNLRKRLDDLEGRSRNTEEAVSTAVVRERQRLGATQVPTSTGSQPPLPNDVQQEIERLDEQIGLAKRQHKGSEVIRLGREKSILIAEAMETPAR